MSEHLSCQAYLEKRCASCTALANPQKLAHHKFLTLQNSLQLSFPEAEYQEARTLINPFNSRAKAKLQVGGTVLNPEIGLDKKVGKKFAISPLLDCPLHISGINFILKNILNLITKYSLTPYSINSRSGELKGIVILKTNTGILVRFIARSTLLKNAFNQAAAELILLAPEVKAVSLNLQPIPHQIVEGDEEHLLLGDSFLRQDYADFFIHLPPLSFVQVTPEIADALYKTACLWLSGKSDRKVLDLFCGAGGFLMSVAPLCKEGKGIELREDSVRCANQAASLQGFKQISFSQGDLNSLSIIDHFDTVIVNPPRRGLGKELIQLLKQIKPKQILYSSCNPETLIADIGMLGYSPKKFKAFDMFPLTEHLEVLALLE